EPADSLAAIALPRVDVTDSSRLLRADAPARLSRAHVALTATWTLASALNAAPGVFIQQGALNTNRLSIRGVGSRIPFATGKVRAYLDEIPLTDGAGITTFEDIDPQWIDHIEVSKGPQSAALGPTLGGALRLRTAAPAVEGTRQVASLRVGSFGTAGAGLMASRAQGGRSSLWGGSLLHSDGYRDNSTYDRAQLLWLGKRLDARAEHSTLVLGTLMKAHIPSSLDATDFAERPWAAAASWAAVSGYEAHRKLLWGHTFRRVKEDRVALIALFGQIRDSWEVRPFNILSENVWNGGMRFRLEGGQAHPWTWRLGGEAMAEDYGWQTFAQVAAQPGALLSHNRERRAYAQLFADGRWQRAGGRWEVAAGLGVAAARFAYSDLFFGDSLDHSATKAFAPVWSPRVQAGWRAGRALWLLGRLSHGIGWPGVEDSRRADGTINPAIRPEQGWNAELGARGVLGTLASFELVVYQMEIRDLLVARRVGPDIYEGVNAGRTRHRGLELDLRTAAWRGLRLEGSLHLSDYRFVDFVDGTADYSGNRLTGWPEHTARLWLWWQHRGWSAVLRHERTGRMPLRDDNSAWSAPYALWHLRVEYQRPFGKWRLRLFAEGRNLTDAHYASMILVNATSFGGSQPRYYYPGPPR
ncbi:MAG: TonB-dependent receptor, partial [Alphaproteobacteria bacterium]